MPVSFASVAQNPGVLATHLVPPAPPPVTCSQPLACTITGWNCSPRELNSSTYPAPTSAGQWNTARGRAGRAQMAMASRRAAAGSRTVRLGICLRSGLVWPSWLSDGVRTTRTLVTLVTAAGSAHSMAPAGAAPDWLEPDWGEPDWRDRGGLAAGPGAVFSPGN